MKTKLVGLMPMSGNHIGNGLQQLNILCDAIIGLEEWGDEHIKSTWITETVEIENDLEVWNDYGNRLTLLARATAHEATHVLWLDSDEQLESGVTRELIERQIYESEQHGCIAVSYAVREMWNATHWRSDGIFGLKRRVVIQKNPLLEQSVQWRPSHLQRLHAFPLQVGGELNAQTQLIHLGMSTPELRKARVEKYAREDPNNECQPQGYSYLVDKTGLELTELKGTV